MAGGRCTEEASRGVCEAAWLLTVACSQELDLCGGSISSHFEALIFSPNLPELSSASTIAPIFIRRTGKHECHTCFQLTSHRVPDFALTYARGRSKHVTSLT